MPSITLHIRIQTKIKLFNVDYDSFYSMLHPCYTHVTLMLHPKTVYSGLTVLIFSQKMICVTIYQCFGLI